MDFLKTLTDQNLLVVAGVVVLVVYSSFKLLESGLKSLAENYSAADRDRTKAIQDLAEAMREGNIQSHRIAEKLDVICRHQERCANQPRFHEGGS